MKKLICIIISLCLMIFPVYSQAEEPPDYGEQHISIVENHSVIPVEVTIQYLMGEDAALENTDEIVETLKEIRRLAATITADYADDYDKARAISGWVADNLYYDNIAAEIEVDFETIALKNVMITRRTICSGYANLTAALLAAIGLKSVTILGFTSFNDDEGIVGNPHEWTAFWYESEQRWVLLDSGWDSWNYFDGEYVKLDAPRRFFDISPSHISNTHRARKAEFRDWFDERFIIFDETVTRVQTEQTGQTERFLDEPKTAEESPLFLYIIIGIMAAVVIAGAVMLKRGKNP
jgi:transglutaminase/protease-like cytokinesis protein 3